MRMVRAGLMPSAAAAACSAVVLNGTGGCCLRLRLATAVTVPVVSPSTCENAASAAALSVKRAVVWATLNSWSEASPSPRICQ
ncbi:Uncharacterised protein [Collinsella intestinalis]|nr:Uncharacterised protein [Collinsella intestinalis]